jgi:hypothetical protein
MSGWGQHKELWVQVPITNTLEPFHQDDFVRASPIQNHLDKKALTFLRARTPKSHQLL